MSLPIYPDFYLDTSREAAVPFTKRLLPWRSRAIPDSDGNVWVSAFATDSIIVRGQCRYKGRVFTALSIVKDAHRKSDREAMEEAEDSIRFQIRDAVPGGPAEGGRAEFPQPVTPPWNPMDLIG